MLRCHGRGQVETHPDRDGCGLVSRRHPHGRFAGIEGEDVKTFLKEVLIPLLIALCLAAFFKPIYMADGVCCLLYTSLRTVQSYVLSRNSWFSLPVSDYGFLPIAHSPGFPAP